MIKKSLYLVSGAPQSLPKGFIVQLKRSDFELALFQDALSLRAAVKNSPPAAIIIGADFAPGKQLAVLSTITTVDPARNIVSFLLTQAMNEVHIHHAFAIGASDVLSSEASAVEIIIKLNRELERRVLTTEFAPIPQDLKEIKHFTIQRELAGGHQSRVYQAYDNLEQRKVALKLFLPRQNVTEDFMRFRREVTILSLLDHQGIVKIHEAWQDNQIYFYSMAWVEGHTLESVRFQQRFRIESQVLEFVMKLLDSVDYCHSQGTIHRDIKPANIMVCQNNSPMLIDFGLARIGSDHQLTKTDVLLGTPVYFAPETIQSADYSRQSDLFAIGLLTLQLLSGRDPVPTDDFLAAMTSLRNGKYLRAHGVGITGPLAQIIDRMIAFDPRHRYKTCKAAKEAIQEYTSYQSEQQFARWRRRKGKSSRRSPTNGMTTGSAAV